MKRQLLAVLSFILICLPAFSEWRFYEETNVSGTVNGTIQKDYILKMQSGSIYQVVDLTLQLVLELSPKALIFQDGEFFKLIVDGFDEPVVCRQLAPPKSLSASPPETSKSPSSSSESTYPDIKLNDLMPEEVQKKAGIHKLDNAEKEQLRRFLIDLFRLGFEQGANPVKAEKTQTPKPSSSVIESTIDGDFEGWEGETIVKLVNGQIWQQVDFHYEYHYAFMPDVIIFSDGTGYKMKVEGIDKAVGVKQLK